MSNENDSYVSVLSDIVVNSVGSAFSLFSSESGDPNDYINITSHDIDVDRRIEATIRNLENYDDDRSHEQLIFKLELSNEISNQSDYSNIPQVSIRQSSDVVDDYLTDGKFIEMEIVLMERAFNIYMQDRCELLHESGSKHDDITAQREYLIKFYQTRLQSLQAQH